MLPCEMNANDIYSNLLNLSDVTVIDVLITDKAIEIKCETLKTSQLCPHCGQLCNKVNSKSVRRLRDLSIANREVHLLVKVREFYCSSCHKYHTENLDFAYPNKGYTARQSKYIFELCQKQSYQEIGAITNMHKKTVERLVLFQCEKNLDLSGRYARVKRLGIDEQSHRKGKKDYICILTNLDDGTIVDILPDRKKETLINHFQSLVDSFCQQITDISCDIWSPYIQVVRECFPNATLVLDRFHVTKLLNTPLDTLRKDLRKEFKDETVYKRLKWILFKQYQKLSDKELDDLHAAFEVNPLLKIYYFQREKFHHILDNQPTVEHAIIAIDKWVQDTQNNKITIFDGFIKTVQKYATYIANYVKDKLSNAVTEGLNNLIRSIRRISFGMPNFEHIRLRAMSISS